MNSLRQRLRQLWAIVALTLGSLPQRLGPSLVVVVGIAAVVGVLLGMLSLSESLARTITAGGRPDRALVMSQGAQLEWSSAIAREAINAIEQAPGIRRTASGEAIVSAEILQPVPVREKSDGARATAIVRGGSPMAFVLRPEMQLVAGRMIQPGLYELLVGRDAQARYKGLDIGEHVKIRGNPFVVVGAFESDGALRESELFTDAQTLLSIRPRAKLQSVTVQLESPGAFATFRDALMTNPTLAVDAVTETVYTQRQAGVLTDLLQLIGYLAGGIMAVAATFGAANTMYTAVSARSVEIATLRAIGFGRGGVVLSVLAEALLLALVGAVVGAAVAAMIVNGRTFNSGALSTHLHIDASLAAMGVMWACGIGILGGLFPALRAARMPIATALREI